ncbi:MAG: Bro-N domain-containing protein [Patescibacteria group bacterium]|nr:Bro-N domain-containing protein [Patescibacteria group bacterium]MCL5431854.1 Bro-N domain-containing protein [Patescibacteria group bacterium]
MPENKIAIFQNKTIRRVIYKNEWWFSVVDVVEVLSGSTNPRDYWFKMKIRVKEEDGLEPSTICRQLKLLSLDGKMRGTDCANTEGILRIVQSIPSSKAEPFKRWLAKVGYDRSMLNLDKILIFLGIFNSAFVIIVWTILAKKTPDFNFRKNEFSELGGRGDLRKVFNLILLIFSSVEILFLIVFSLQYKLIPERLDIVFFFLLTPILGILTATLFDTINHNKVHCLQYMNTCSLGCHILDDS